MNTNKILTHVASKIATKTATLQDFVLQAMAKAVRHAESEGEANYLFTKAVLKLATPLKNPNKIRCNANGDPYYTVRSVLKGLTDTPYVGLVREPYYKYLYNYRYCVDADDIKVINQMAKIAVDMFERHYLYIFVRQDICAEQQAVQAAHATFVAGAQIAKESLNTIKPFDASKTHFVLIGVPDLNALYEARGIAAANGIDTHEFYEEDLDNQMTAFTTGIVTQEKRAVFKQYGLLKFARGE